jgi:hypothetical protein
VGSYSYTALFSDIPGIPIMPVMISTPGPNPILSVEIQGVLDTGSDCTLIPFNFLAKVNVQVSDRAIQIPVGGQVLLAVPYLIGLTFDRYTYSVHQVYGCSLENIGELLIIGRDILNLHRVEFDGLGQSFSIL